MDADEDVVFQNSALYEHLRELGYSDEDVTPETLRPDHDDAHYESYDEQNDYRRPPQKPTFWRKLKKSVDKAFWDENWTDQLTQLHNKYADEFTDAIMDSPVLEEEDGTYIESFFLSMQSYRPEGHQGETSIMGTMLMQLAILGVSLAYAAFRMIYLKSPGVTSRMYVWSIDVLAVLLTIAALTPTTVKSASAGNIVSKLKTFSSTSQGFLSHVTDTHKLMKKSMRLIQELELVARGFTMISPGMPVVRIEQGGATTRQCPRLRQLTFHAARDIMLNVKYATRRLLNSFPSHVEIEGFANYLANQPLHMYGPCVMTMGKHDSKKLRVATDDYSLAAIRAMVDLCNLHLSEFLRVLAMSVLTCAEEHDQNPSFRQQGDVLEKMSKKIESHAKPLSKLYTLHKCLSASKEKKNPEKRPQKPNMTESLYIAVHSLSLHLRAAQQRILRVEEELEILADTPQLQGDGKPPDDLLTRLTSDLKVVQVDLSACQDCADESQEQADRCRHKSEAGTTSAAPSGDSKTEQPTSGAGEKTKAPIPLFEMGDPIVQDQVFEAYTDSVETDTSHDDGEWLLTDEEREKRKREKQEAIRVLKELRSVIAVRAVEREARERAALIRQYPHGNFTDPIAALRKQTRAEDDGAMPTHHDNSGDDVTMETAGVSPLAIQSACIDDTDICVKSSSTSCDVDDHRECSVECGTNLSITASASIKSECEQELKSNKTAWTSDPDPPCDPESHSDVPSDSNPEYIHDPEDVSAAEDIPDVDDIPESAHIPGTGGLDPLRQRLADMGGANFPFSSNIAAMAVARSHQMAALSVDTFGDDDDDSEDDDVTKGDDNDEDETVDDFVDISRFPPVGLLTEPLNQPPDVDS